MAGEPRRRQGSEGAAARILVVEDDPEMLALVQEMLREDGYEALGSPDTLSALMHLMGEGADVLVTDWKMPALSGLHLLESARRCLPDLPVILITAFADPALERQARAGGASSILAKPFRHGELLHHVRSALALRRDRSGRPGRERFHPGRSHTQ
jgi:DNA-binding response OmpR family regulator